MIQCIGPTRIICLVAIALVPGALASEATMVEQYRELLDVDAFSVTLLGNAEEDAWHILQDATAWKETSLITREHEAAETVFTETDGGLCLDGTDISLTLVSPRVGLDETCRAVSGVVLASGDGLAEVNLLWLLDNTILTRIPFREPPARDSAARRFNLSESERPKEANGFVLVLAATPEGETSVCWRVARAQGIFEYEPKIQLSINRVGYEQQCPKHFSVYSNFRADTGRFLLLNEAGELVYEDSLSSGERMPAAEELGGKGYHYRGDFSAWDDEGAFLLVARLDNHDPVSAEVRIGYNLLWENAFAPALAPFRSNRSPENEDGAFRLWRCHDKGCEPHNDAEVLWELVRSWTVLRGLWNAHPVFASLNEEVTWAVREVARHVLNASGDATDNSLYRRALSAYARFEHECPEIMEAATALTDAMMAAETSNSSSFASALDMFAATGDKTYLVYAERVFPGITLDEVEALLDYEDLTGDVVTIFLIDAFQDKGRTMLRAANNPYGFFLPNSTTTGAEENVHNQALAAAAEMAQAHRYTIERDYLNFVYDQLNWVLGNNPMGVCFVEGLWGAHVPFSAEKTSGRVLDGPTRCAQGEQRLCFDAATPRWSLTNNARYISALAYLKRIPSVRPRRF